MTVPSNPLRPTPDTAARNGATNGAQIIGARNNTDGPGPELMLADTLTGDKVVNMAEEHVGDIKGIMLDVPSGRIAYAVLAVGGFLGIGERLFAIPWGALTLDTDHKRFVLDVSKEKLKEAKGFDKDHWPSMADRQWASQIHTYYNVRPYWE